MACIRCYISTRTLFLSTIRMIFHHRLRLEKLRVRRELRTGRFFGVVLPLSLLAVARTYHTRLTPAITPSGGCVALREGEGSVLAGFGLAGLLSLLGAQHSTVCK